MFKLKIKLAFFNLLSKLIFTIIFILLMPHLVEKINILHTDRELIEKREKIIDLIAEIGIDPFINLNLEDDAFGSYNILKEEFISLERVQLEEDWNFIEITRRIIENEEIEYRVLNYSFEVDGFTYLLEIGKSLSSIKHTEKNIKNVIWIFIIFIIVITLLSDQYFTQTILRPLDLIIHKLKNTSTPGFFDKIPVKTTTSDFYQLDQTLIDLMKKMEELLQKEKDITVNISHELMTPVSVLRGNLENILLQENLDHETSVRIGESLKTLHRLKTLVNSLLLIARIESKQYMKNDSVSINELMEEIIGEISPIAVDKDVKINFRRSNDFIFSNANRSLIFSMFYNVVNNAVKNTEAPGEVNIQSFRVKDHYKLIISDTGKGMTEEQLKTIFMRFNKKYPSDEEGTGIGLAITKSIADFHNIDIKVESDLNKGTTFSFLFQEIS